MRTTVTLYRYFYKKVEFEIDSKETEGLTFKEIGNKLINEDIVFDSEQVHDAPLESFEDAPLGEETDRFDIYDKEDNHIYGGHL